MPIAAVFPGQGSHRAGSLDPWRDHPAYGVADVISAAIGRDIVALTQDPDAGSRTADAQPAIFASSLVAWHAFASHGIAVDVVAGHSLGEYTAAVAAGCFDTSDGARLVAARGAAMGAACAANPGTMAAVVKLAPEVVDALVSQIDGLVVANDNAAGQVVVAGPPDAVAAVRDRARDAGGRAVPLDVEGAFHSPAMASAVKTVRDTLATMTVNDPQIPLVTGTSGDVFDTGSAIGAALVAGILAPVRWREVQETLIARGITDVVEIGPGGVLAGLAKRAMPQMRMHRIESPNDLATVTATLKNADASHTEVAP